MNSITEILWAVIAVPIALLVYIGIYAVLCLPGILIIKLFKRYAQRSFKKEAIPLAAIRSFFMAPFPIIGHSVIVVPYPFGLLAYFYNVGTKINIYWQAFSLFSFFICSWGYSSIKKRKTKEAC